MKIQPIYFIKMLTVKVVNKSEAGLPEYKTPGSAGVDLKSTEEVTLYRGDSVLVGTGLYLSIPEGYEAQIRPRSGLAINHGITVLNSHGTIDSDYRGEIKIILHNTSIIPYTIEKGERIAQMVFNKVERVTFEEVDSLDDTERGDGGFGHSGKM